MATSIGLRRRVQALATIGYTAREVAAVTGVPEWLSDEAVASRLGVRPKSVEKCRQQHKAGTLAGSARRPKALA